MAVIKVDEHDPIGELLPSFPYRDVYIKHNVDMRDYYDLMEEIGRGKFGTVYRCSEKSTGNVLAAKFVAIAKKQERRNVEREVEIMNNLQHPRLIQLYDSFEMKNVMCVVLELIEGGELFERVIDDDFVLTEKSCAVFMRQICEGVSFIHENNIIHLDLKPENILCLTRTGNRIKIIDFGLARKFEPDKKLQVLFGTPEFVAPEVVNFDLITTATDMWSVGVICYVLLSGLSPFMGENDLQTMTNVTMAQFDYDDEAFDNISDEAKDFIRKLLVKDKDQRLSATHCLSHNWLRRKPPPPPPRLLETSKENLKHYVENNTSQSTPDLSINGVCPKEIILEKLKEGTNKISILKGSNDAKYEVNNPSYIETKKNDFVNNKELVKEIPVENNLNSNKNALTIRNAKEISSFTQSKLHNQLEGARKDSIILEEPQALADNTRKEALTPKATSKNEVSLSPSVSKSNDVLTKTIGDTISKKSLFNMDNRNASVITSKSLLSSNNTNNNKFLNNEAQHETRKEESIMKGKFQRSKEIETNISASPNIQPVQPAGFGESTIKKLESQSSTEGVYRKEIKSSQLNVERELETTTVKGKPHLVNNGQQANQWKIPTGFRNESNKFNPAEKQKFPKASSKENKSETRKSEIFNNDKEKVSSTGLNTESDNKLPSNDASSKTDLGKLPDKRISETQSENNFYHRTNEIINTINELKEDRVFSLFSENKQTVNNSESQSRFKEETYSLQTTSSSVSRSNITEHQQKSISSAETTVISPLQKLILVRPTNNREMTSKTTSLNKTTNKSYDSDQIMKSESQIKINTKNKTVNSEEIVSDLKHKSLLNQSNRWKLISDEREDVFSIGNPSKQVESASTSFISEKLGTFPTSSSESGNSSKIFKVNQTVNSVNKNISSTINSVTPTTSVEMRLVNVFSNKLTDNLPPIETLVHARQELSQNELLLNKQILTEIPNTSTKRQKFKFSENNRDVPLSSIYAKDRRHSSSVISTINSFNVSRAAVNLNAQLKRKLSLTERRSGSHQKSL